MDVSVVRGVADNGLALEWIKLKTLGIGSYGVVDLVKPIKSVSDDQVLAVKSCHYSDSDLLRKELDILQQFAGCGKIVQCYGDVLSFEKGMSFYNLLLEYAPGGTLWDLIKKYGGKIPESDVKCYAKMLLEGIHRIHAKGYVHCDLKPDNILVFPPAPGRCGGTLKIADFGLARRPREKYITEAEPWMLKFPGTSFYMPPESVATEKISPALDIWSLGCTVLQMLTGKLPWEHAENRMDLAIKIGFSRCPPNKIPETMSSAGKDFLMKCFARGPSERSTADMLLSHPFLIPESTKSLDCLPSLEELEAM